MIEGSKLAKRVREQVDGVDARVYWGLAALVVLAYVLFDPVYVWGTSNQTSQIPMIRHAMDPAHLAQDWAIDASTGASNPRFAYVHLMAGLASLVGLQAALAGAFSLGTVAGIGFLYLVTRELFDDALVGLVVVGFFVSPMTTLIDLGGNPLLGTSLIPTTIANPLILAAAWLLLRDRPLPAYLALGAATAIHLVNGVLGTGVLTVAYLASRWPREARQRFGSVAGLVPWRAWLGWLVVAGPFLAPILWANLSSTGGHAATFITAWIRHPHHHVPSAWPVIELVATGAFVATGGALLARRGTDPTVPEHRRFALAYTGTLVGTFLIGAFVVEVYPIDVIVKLQVFHVDDFLFVPLAGVLAAWGFDVISRVVPQGVRARQVQALAVAGIVVAGIGLQAASGGVDPDLVRGPEHHPALAETYTWIRSNTPDDAVFVAPPEDASFRMSAQRAEVANWKLLPFEPSAMLEWKERLDRLCGADVANLRAMGDPVARCKQGFASLSQAQISGIAEDYGACWVLTTNTTYGFDVAHRAQPWVVYDLRDRVHCEA